MEKFNSASALFFGVLLLLSLFGCNAPEDRLHESWSLYENGDKEQHLKILHELADQDYPPALYSLGIHYGDWIDGFYGGQSAIVEIDIPRSIDLHLKALDLGYVDSAYPAMELLSTFGDPINRNWEKIVELRKAEVDHYPSSLARLYRDGFVVERNLDESINLFRKSANQGTIEHQLALFELLAGDKLEPARKEKVEALKWLSVLKNRLSEGRALEIYWPNNIENNMSESELAEARNLSESLFSEISWNWQNRHGFSQHLQNWPAPSPAKIESTISTLENYARQGNPNAQYLLSAVITSGGINAGFFFAKNPSEQALYWLKEAASQDYPPAIEHLGNLAYLNPTNDSNLKDAEDLWIKAAKFGSFRAIAGLVSEYSDDESSIYNLVKARAWQIVYLQSRADWLNSIKKQISNGLTQEEVNNALNAADAFVPERRSRVSLMPGAWPSTIWLIAGLLCSFALIILSYLASITLKSDPQSERNRLVSAVLILEGAVLALVFIPFALPASEELVSAINNANRAVALIIPLLIAFYLNLTGMFSTRLSGFMENRAIHRSIWISAFAAGMLGIYLAITGFDPLEGDRFLEVKFDSNRPGLAVSFGDYFNWMWVGVLVVHAYVLFVLGLYYFQSEPDSKFKRQSGIYASAYLLRFLFLGAAIAKMSWDSLISDYGAPPTSMAITIIIYAIGELMFGIMFSLGILREQIFGIEQLFKRNLVRLILFGSVTLAFLFTEQLIENLFSDEYGSIGGMAAALIMLGLHKNLTHMLRDVLDRLIPDENNIDQDAETIYQNHYELAIKHGQPSSREREMLNFTARSLGLSKARKAAIEGQFATI